MYYANSSPPLLGLRAAPVEEKEADEEDLKTICFVCKVGRFTADQNGIGFDKQVKLEHNPKYYLFFLIYLQRKPWYKPAGLNPVPRVAVLGLFLFV